jgi:hypothetical protein
MRDLLHDAQLYRFVRQQPQRLERLRPRGGSEQAPGRSGALRHAPPKNACRADRAESVPARHRVLPPRSARAPFGLWQWRSAEHPGDLSVAERLWLGVFAYVVGFEQDAGSVQLTRRGGARRDELVQVLSLLLAQLNEVFLFHSGSPPKTDQPQDTPLDTNIKSSLTED